MKSFIIISEDLKRSRQYNLYMQPHNRGSIFLLCILFLCAGANWLYIFFFCFWVTVCTESMKNRYYSTWHFNMEGARLSNLKTRRMSKLSSIWNMVNLFLWNIKINKFCFKNIRRYKSSRIFEKRDVLLQFCYKIFWLNSRAAI